MPIWSLEELERCRKSIYPETVNYSLMRNVYGKWGGIVRLAIEQIINRNSSDDVDKTQEEVLNQCDIQALKNNIQIKKLEILAHSLYFKVMACFVDYLVSFDISLINTNINAISITKTIPDLVN